MKKYITDNELLSAYIDDELSSEEKKDLVQRLTFSPELRKKHQELLKLKELTKASVKELPESPYFETRFFAELSGGKTGDGKLKKYIPAVGFAVLAVALMFILRSNPDMLNRIVEEQKTNLAGFYKENLKPLLYAADLTNEDVFNFAFANTIPLDEKDKQVLQLGYDESGKEFFEIKTLNSAPLPENNLERFVAALNLNEGQKKQIDSILESYAEDLQTQILVNDKNTVAINPNLWNYNKAIAADLLSFASSASSKELGKILPSVYTIPEKNKVKQYVNGIKASNEKNYIFVTPDTIFTEAYEFDKGKFKVEIQNMKKELNQEMDELQKEMKKMAIELNFDSSIQRHKHSVAGKNFIIHSDSNSFKVFVPGIPSPDIRLPVFDSLNVYLENLSKNLEGFSFNFEMPEKGKNNSFSFKFKDSSSTFDVKIPMTFGKAEIDSIFKSHSFNMDSLSLPQMNMYFNTDSLVSKFRHFIPDSTFNSEEFRKDMKELEEEMKEFRQEMNELRKDLNKKEKIKVEKKPVEI